MDSTNKGHIETTDADSLNNNTSPIHMAQKSKKKPVLLITIALIALLVGSCLFFFTNTFRSELEFETEPDTATVDYCKTLGEDGTEDSQCNEYLAQATRCLTPEGCPETAATLGASVGDFVWPIALANWPKVAEPIVNCSMLYSDKTIATGFEIAVPAKTKVYATAAGKVTVANMNSGKGVIVIDTGIKSSTGDGRTVRINYNYLSAIDAAVKVGQQVKTGQYIGLSGSGDAASALKGKPSLHYGIWKAFDTDGVIGGHVPYFKAGSTAVIGDSAKVLVAKLYHPMNFLPRDGRDVKSCSTTKKAGEFTVPGVGTVTTPVPTPTPSPATGFVTYSQLDPRWRSGSYNRPDGSHRTIGQSGCGPTSVAMVIATLKKNGIKPPEMANWSKSHGYRDSSGTAWGLFTAAPRNWGLKSKDIGTNFTAAAAGLRNGGLIIVSGKGYPPFGSGGHIIVLRSVDSKGNFKVADPLYPYQVSSSAKYNHAHTNEKTYTAAQLKAQAAKGGGRVNNMWLVTK